MFRILWEEIPFVEFSWESESLKLLNSLVSLSSSLTVFVSSLPGCRFPNSNPLVEIKTLSSVVTAHGVRSWQGQYTRRCCVHWTSYRVSLTAFSQSLNPSSLSFSTWGTRVSLINYIQITSLWSSSIGLILKSEYNLIIPDQHFVVYKFDATIAEGGLRILSDGDDLGILGGLKIWQVFSWVAWFK